MKTVIIEQYDWEEEPEIVVAKNVNITEIERCLDEFKLSNIPRSTQYVFRTDGTLDIINTKRQLRNYRNPAWQEAHKKHTKHKKQ